MSDIITPKEFLQNKYKYYKKHWNEHKVINDEFIVGEMQAYSEYVQSQANGDNKEQDEALRLPDVVPSTFIAENDNEEMIVIFAEDDEAAEHKLSKQGIEPHELRYMIKPNKTVY